MSLSVSESVEPAVRVARGASYLLLQGIVINIMGVFYFVFATRLLPTVADFGRISTVNIFAVLVVSVGSLGLPTAATRFIAKYVASEQEGQARIVYQKVLRVGIGLSILSLSSVVLGSQVLSQLFLGSPDFGFLFQLAGLDVFFQLLALFPLGALQGVYRFREVAIINIASNVLQFAGAVYLLTIGLGLTGIMMGWIIGDALGALLSLTAASRHFPMVGRGSLQDRGKISRFAVSVYGSTLITFASTYVDRFLVLFFAGASALGIYSPVLIIVGVLGLVSTGITGALLPQLTDLHARKGDIGLRDAAKVSSRYFFILYLPFAIGLAVTAGPTIRLFAGERYGDGALPLAILAIGLGLTSASVVIGSSLLAVGNTRVLISASALGILADIAFAPLIFLFGVTGAALSRVALMTASLGCSWIILERKYPRSVDLAAFYKALVCCLVEGGVVGTAEFALHDKYLLPLYIVLGFVGYLASLRILRVVNSGDVALLHRFVPSRLRFLVDIFGWLLSTR